MRIKPSPETECQAGPSNRNSLGFLDPKQLTWRPGDPRRFDKEAIARAIDVVRSVPPTMPLPVVVNEKGQVLVGHLLVRAAVEVGLPTITVIVHAGTDPIDESHYSVAITQILTKGTWDSQDLEVLVREFEASIEDFSHFDLGFSNGELDKILGTTAGGGSTDDDVPKSEITAVSRVGICWLLGRHRLLVGDATNREHFAQLMGDQQAGMVITDPPYGCPIDGFVSKKGKHREFVEASGEKSPDQLWAFFLAFLRNLAASMRPGALAYLFIDWRSVGLLHSAAEEVFGEMVQMCCWVKNRAGMGSLYRSQHELVLIFRAPGDQHINNVQLGRHGRNRSNVWDYPSAASSRGGREGDMLKSHPTPKTVEMIADAILDCTRRRDIVVDCFIGSGTAIIAAERTGRTCYGMELDPLYADVAVRRWQTRTGLKAIDEASGRTFDELAFEAEHAGGDHE